MGFVIGLILCALAGVGVGTFLLPLKFSKNWKWENSWMAGAVVMYCILPILVLPIVSDNPLAIYQEVGTTALVALFVCGLIQGTGALVFTYGTTIMGLALGYALMIGCIMVFGLLVPLVGEHHDRILKIDGVTLMIGLAILLLGIWASGKAGLMREREKPADAESQRNSVSLSVIVLVVLWSGIANSFYYFIHEFSDPAIEVAKSCGVDKTFAPLFINAPFFLGMLAINIALTIPKMIKDKSLKNYWSGGALGLEYVLAVLIGLMWFLGQGIAYPLGYTKLGDLGVSVGAALFMGTMIIISNVLGVSTGEWKGVSAAAKKKLYTGLALLVLAMVVISVGNSLREEGEKKEKETNTAQAAVELVATPPV